MALTAGQIKALHAAAREAGVPEDLRRSVQWHVGGFHSCSDRTAGRAGMIAVMAFYELRAGGSLRGCSPGYWQSEDARANRTDALVYACRREARAMGLSDRQLDAFVAGSHMSNGACADVATATAYWLRKLLDGLKAIRRRHGRRGGGVSGLGVGAAGPQPGGAPSSGPSAPPGMPAVLAGPETATPTPNPQPPAPEET